MRRWLEKLGLAVLVCLAAQAARATEDPPRSGESTSVSFCAMGDAPYIFFEDLLIRSQVQALPELATFLVHVGDIKRGATPCDESHYEAIANLLRRSTKPALILPGDNEWNDCPDPDAAWRYWTKRLLRLEEHWKLPFVVKRQEIRPENFRFAHEGVAFIGLNLVGGALHNPREWRRRHDDNLQWVRAAASEEGRSSRAIVIFGHALPTQKHDDFFGPLVEWSRHDGRPLLYLHGDGHAWKEDRGWRAPNIHKLQLDRGGLAPPVLVTVTSDAERPFLFDRRLK